MTAPLPTGPEIEAIADRIARELVTYALSDIRDLLGTDCISEAIEDDQAANRIEQAEGQLFGLVWDRLGKASSEYRPVTTSTTPEA